MSSSSAFEDLMADWFSGVVLNPDQQAQLEAILRQDAQCRQRFIDASMAEMALVEAAKAAAAVPAVQALSRPEPRQRRSPSRRVRSRVSPATMVWFPALALAAAVCLVWMLIGQDQPTRKQPTLIAEAPVPLSEPHFRITQGDLRSGDQTWSPGQEAPWGPSQLTVGSSGLGLSLGDDLRIVADAGARLVLRARERIVLDHGRIEADIIGPLAAPGFAIVTAECEVRVRGTRFAVTRQQAVSRVAVDRGQVSLLAHGHSRDLKAGESAAADSSGLLTWDRVQLVLHDGQGMERLVGGDLSQAPTISLPVGPGNLRLDAPPAVRAVRAWLDGTPVGLSRPLQQLEQDFPFFLWGDRDGLPHLEHFTAGRHQLRIEAYLDLGETQAMPALELVFEVGDSE